MEAISERQACYVYGIGQSEETLLKVYYCSGEVSFQKELEIPDICMEWNY